MVAGKTSAHLHPIPVYWWRVRLQVSVATVLCLVTAAPANAQVTSVTAISGLNFGSFVANGSGSVTVAASGLRSKSGSVTLLSQGAPAAAAQFTVSGSPNASYSISLPTESSLTGPGSAMTLSIFTSTPSGSGLLAAGGTQTLSVGATLTVGASQTPGTYSGNFNVTVQHP